MENPQAKEIAHKTILISHELANIGRLDITLHGIAAAFYEQLRDSGLIEYLKGLDHLGYLSKCHPGNHHKRWDYVCLQLFFLQKLKHSTFNTGLNSYTTLDRYNATNQEILQTFIFFSNIGHLEGTLSSEKGLFDFLKENRDEKNKFLSEIEQMEDLKDFSDKIFSSFDVYKVKYLIALNYLLKSTTSVEIVSAVRLILKKYLAENDEKFEKLKLLFFKIRKVSFVYLDSLHCPIPIQVNLSKILVNIFNYDLLFNPVDRDYDVILEACETVLSKELYISPKASLTFCSASNDFVKFLKTHKSSDEPLDYSNFLTSLVAGRKDRYTTKFPQLDSFHIFQFYLAKDALKFFEVPIDGGFEGSLIQLHEKEPTLRKVLNEGLRMATNDIVIQHDMRKSLIFFTILINKDSDIREAARLLFNFNKAFVSVLETFNIELSGTDLDEVLSVLGKNFKKDVVRRYFLYILKFLFEKNNRLNLYIQFKYRQLIISKNTSSPIDRIYETSFISGKKALIAELQNYLNKKLPEDIDNNIHIMIDIVEHEIEMTGDISFFYSIFPIEIEEMVYSASELDKSGNAEKRTILTDIDAMLVAFQQNKYEFILIEGKKHRNGFRKECTKDLIKVKKLSNKAEIFSDPVMREVGNFKGGYLRVTSELSEAKRRTPNDQ